MSEQEQKESPQVIESQQQQQQRIFKTIKSAYLKYLLCAIPCIILVAAFLIIITMLVARLW